jgi:hypothetical protein
MQRQVEELSHQLAEMKKRILEDREKNGHRNMTNFENPFKGISRGGNFFIRMNMTLTLKKCMILVLVWIGINHQNLMKKKLKMSLSLRVAEILKAM